MAEGAERLSGLVGGQGLVAQAELLVPELKDALDRGLAHVPVRVPPELFYYFCTK